MPKIQIINGANLNLLGKREPFVYGNIAFEDFFANLKQDFPQTELHYFQSNNETEIIEKIHQCNHFEGIIINAGAYSHTSLAIADALRAINVAQIIEVHISNIYARENFRKRSYLSSVCKGSICGLGLDGYRLAIEHIVYSYNLK